VLTAPWRYRQKAKPVPLNKGESEK
jgi:hypothetical protein